MTAYEETTKQSEAMKAIGRPLRELRQARRAYPEFDAAVKEVYEIVLDLHEEEAERRGMDGWEEPIVFKGEIMKNPDGTMRTIRRKSDSMLQFVLMAGRREKFGRNLKVAVDDIDDAIKRGLAELAALEKDSTA